ncbi:hypothetical protein [Streptomyces sp. NPDC101234]|uniref:hypothetical protein n=1 Tax=Streptomyces sp. NPDC101234 TaxID=3366138 RepID=UPI0038180275
MPAPQAVRFAELFRTRTRLSGFAFVREIGSVLAGGLASFVATASLIRDIETPDSDAPPAGEEVSSGRADRAGLG